MTGVLFREIGLIEDCFVEEAEDVKKIFAGKRKRRWIVGMTSAAACLLLCLSAAVAGKLLTGGLAKPAENGAGGIKAGGSVDDMPGGMLVEENVTETTQEAEMDEYALVLNRADTAAPKSIAITGHFWEELSEEQIEALFPGDVSERLSDCEISGMVHFQSEDGENASVFNVELQIITPSGCDVYVQLKQGEPVIDYLFDVGPQLSYIMGVPVTAGVFEGSWEAYFAEFKLGDLGYYVETNGGKAEKAAFADLLDKLISAGEADFSIFYPIEPK